MNSIAKAPAPQPYNGPVFYCNEVNGLDVYMKGGCKSVSVSTIYDDGGGQSITRIIAAIIQACIRMAGSINSH